MSNQTIIPLKKTDIQLYYTPRTRSNRPRWLLEELGVPYELIQIDLSKGEHRQKAYRAINPLAKVPALVDGDVVLTESLAICMHLADRFPEKTLAPPQGSKARASYYNWMAYSTGTVEPAILVESHRRKTNEKGLEYLSMGPAMTCFTSAASVLENALSQSPFVLGQEFSAADVMLGTLMIWAKSMKLLQSEKHINEWIKDLRKRPAYIKAMQD